MSTREKVFEFIQRFINDRGYSPTIREICNGTGLKSTSTVHRHIERLEKVGVLTWNKESPRTIRILKETTTHCASQSELETQSS